MAVSAELERREELGFDVAYAWDKAAEVFTPERKQQVAQFLSIDAVHPAFDPFLAVSAALGLNPILGEIWLIPVSNRVLVDGTWTDGPKKFRPAVGRDGFLSLARRDPSYRGLDCDVIHEEDEFLKLSPKKDGETIRERAGVVHNYGNPAKRGQIVGAWVAVDLIGREPFYYYGPLLEHARTKMKNSQKVYDGAWGYTHSMMLKSVQSYGLRISMGVTGVIPVDEMTDDPADHSAEPVANLSADQASVWDTVEETLQNDGTTFRKLQEVTNGWPAARVEMELSGRTAADLAELADRYGQMAAEPEEEVPEAEVVDEPGATAGDAADAADADHIEEDADAEPEAPNVDEALDEKPEQDRDPAEAPLQEEADASSEEVLAMLRTRLESLRESAGGELTDDAAAEIDAEIQQVEEEIASRMDDRPEDPDQPSLL